MRVYSSLKPMLPTAAPEPFSHPDWLYEPKWDGFRALAIIDGNGIRLLSRHGSNMAHQFPELTARPFTADHVVVDGELISIDQDGRPDFSQLLNRARLDNAERIANMRHTCPVVYVVFDLLELDGRDLRDTPLVERKALLQNTLYPDDNTVASDYFEIDGLTYYDAVVARGLEGVVAKKRASLYRPGIRTRSWLKWKRPDWSRAWNRL